jgi:hypothetical protein
MSKIYVIAGHVSEAEYWIKSNLEKRAMSGVTTLSRSDYVYVSEAVRLRGIRDPHGVFVGSWKNRQDILEIVETLMLQSTNPNPALGKIHKELNGSESMLRVKRAANALAEEIDAEVMASLCKKINGGELSGNTTSNDR